MAANSVLGSRRYGAAETSRPPRTGPSVQRGDIIARPPPTATAGAKELGAAGSFGSSISDDLRRLFGPKGRPGLRRQLCILAAGILLVLVANIAGQVRLNSWNGAFFEAIESRGLAAFSHQL